MNAAIETEKSAPVTLENVTIYRGGMFGYVRHECCRVEVTRAPYAQYAEAIHVRMLEKGKRKPRGFTKAGLDSPFVILKGFGHPEELVPTFNVEEGTGNRITRHASYAPEWETEFRAALDAYLVAKPTGVFMMELEKSR